MLNQPCSPASNRDPASQITEWDQEAVQREHRWTLGTF